MKTIETLALVQAEQEIRAAMKMITEANIEEHLKKTPQLGILSDPDSIGNKASTHLSNAIKWINAVETNK